METPTRTIAKAVSWQLLGLFSMGVIGYLFTGSFLTAGSLAVVTTATGAICYVFHERVWNRISWGRITPLDRGAAPLPTAAARRAGGLDRTSTS